AKATRSLQSVNARRRLDSDANSRSPVWAHRQNRPRVFIDMPRIPLQHYGGSPAERQCESCSSCVTTGSPPPFWLEPTPSAPFRFAVASVGQRARPHGAERDSNSSQRTRVSSTDAK